MADDLIDPDGLPADAGQPPWVAEAVRRIESGAPAAKQRAILTRLLADPRLETAAAQLRRHSRPNGGFLYPATSSPHTPHRTRDEAQAAALSEMLHFVFCVAINPRTAGKLEGVEPDRLRLQQEAATLRRVADVLTASVYAAPHIPLTTLEQYLADAEALRRVAAWRDATAATIRGADDPLTIVNSSGDPTLRAVQSDMASFLKERFGNHLHGVAAILAAVALGLPVIPDAAISRSAHSRPKKA